MKIRKWMDKNFVAFGSFLVLFLGRLLQDAVYYKKDTLLRCFRRVAGANRSVAHFAGMFFSRCGRLNNASKRIGCGASRSLYVTDSPRMVERGVEEVLRGSKERVEDGT